MKKKKIILIASIIIFALLVIGIVCIFSFNNYSKIFNSRVDELQQKLIDEKEFNYEKEGYNVFISISDSEKKAYVRNGSGKTLEEAIEDTKERIKQVIDNEKIEPKWIKIDVIDDVRTVSKEELNSLLENSTYYLSSGISFDDNFEVALLESELNSNNIINYDDGYLNLEQLNEYLNSSNKNLNKSLNDYNNVTMFDCVSYIYDDTGIYRINSNDSYYGRRAENNLDKNRLLEIITSACNYLEKNIKEDGSFLYEYYVVEGEETNSYNILRHEGTIWSMIQTYTLQPNAELKDKIELALDYVINNAVKYKDDNTVYIKEIQNNELKLGANGIAVLMLTDYMNTFNTNEYEELVVKIGNAILEMQNEDGSFYHVYSYPDFSEEEEYRTVYYDGEATFALMKLYEFTKDEKWINAAEKAMDYFVDNNYEQYEDQWIEYAINAMIEYKPKKEYFELGLNNIKDNYATILDNRNQSATKLELLVTGLEIYDKAIENNIDVSFINIKGIMNAIDIRINYQLNCYFYPEYAMYFNNPERILYSFFVRDSDYRIRIDDVQHNINAFYQLYQIYEIFEKYSS